MQGGSRVGVEPTARSRGSMSPPSIYSRTRRGAGCRVPSSTIQGSSRVFVPFKLPVLTTTMDGSGTPALDLVLWGPGAPDDIAPDLRLARCPWGADECAVAGPGPETRRSRSGRAT